MKILIVNQACIPVQTYGGTERVIWDLGKALTELGHEITFLVPEGSTCPFAKTIAIQKGQAWNAQIPKEIDMVHFQFNPQQAIEKPNIVTEHGNQADGDAPLLSNTVFVSQRHAQLHGGSAYVYNGLDWRHYTRPNLDAPRGGHFHFLAKAAWRVKNVRGAIALALKAQSELDVLGGTRLNLKRGFRLTLSPKIHFHGMVDNAQKSEFLQSSRGLLFPVRWHEPFGLAVIESMYFGCPVFATPYGALPELVPKDCGALSHDGKELLEYMLSWCNNSAACHQQVVQRFNHITMGKAYLEKYEQVLAKEPLNQGVLQRKEAFKDLTWLAP